MLATRTTLPKPVLLTGLLAAALLIFMVPAGAAELPAPQGAGCAYSGPTSLAQAPGSAAPAAELFAPDFEHHVHLGSGEAADLRFEELQQHPEVRSFGVGDQQERWCHISSQTCGPWYRTGDCCFTVDQDQEAQQCQSYWTCSDGNDFTGTSTYYKCVGAFCH